MEKTLKSQKAFQHIFKWRGKKAFALNGSPGDDEVLLPASLLGHKVDVPVEHCHQHAHLNKKKCEHFQNPTSFETNHKATDEADEANNHAVLAKQILDKNVLLVGPSFIGPEF